MEGEEKNIKVKWQKHKAEGENREIDAVCGKWCNNEMVVKMERHMFSPLQQALK